MNISNKLVQRPVAALSALALLVGTSIPAFLVTQEVGAAQIQSRSVKMSDSTPSATGVNYTVTFTTATTAVIQGVVVDFCAENPIIGEACTAPTGMNVSSVGWTSPATGLDPATGWTAAGSGGLVTMTNASGISVPASTQISFELTNITNPLAAGTFYARILTYTTPGGATGYTSISPGSYTDYGGAALSAALNIPVTAKVMETLMFCTSDTTPVPSDCVGASQPNVNLGKTVGGTLVLDSASVYTDNVYARLATNAVSGAIIRVKTTSSTACSGLSKDSGATCTQIPGTGSSVATITAGTAAFGMCIEGVGGLTADANYSSVGCTQFGMDAVAATSTYGDELASTASTVSGATATITYAATASNVTPAGIYTTTQSLIATGTF